MSGWTLAANSTRPLCSRPKCYALPASALNSTGKAIASSRHLQNGTPCGPKGFLTMPEPSPTNTSEPDPDDTPDYETACDVCEALQTGMCGPCTFGEAATAGGNW